MTVINKIGQMIPNVILDHVILRKLHPTDTDSITVSLHFHIDEYIYSDNTGTWVTDADYVDKLAIECVLDRGGFGNVEVFDASTHEIISLTRNTMHKITYKKDINIPASDLSENMTLSLRTSIRGTDAGIDWGEVTPINLYGKTSSVEVVRNGKVQTRVLGYFLGDKFYNGPKFQLANGRWVTGNVQSPSSQPLIERNVPNIKLYDDRDLIAVEDLSDYIEEASADSCLPAPILPNFSNISATRDDKNTLKYLFTLDYSQAYDSNTLYKSVYRGLSPRLKDRLLRMSKLRNLTLFRKRQGYADEAGEIIISSGEVSGDNFIDTETEDGSIREEDFSFNKDLTYRTFSGVDKNFENVTAGKYQFRVSADIQDGIYTFLSFQIADLAVSKQLLDEYVAKYPTTSEELFAGLILEHGPTDKEIADYVNSVNAKTDFLNRPYIRALVSLSEAVYFLPGITGDKATRLINSFRSYLSPVTGDIDTLNAVRGTYNTISNQVEAKMDLVRQNAANSLESPNASRGNLLYNIAETFSQVFDATESYKNGLNFLSSKSSTTATSKVPGLYSVTNPDFEARITRENKNFFKSANVVFSLGTGDTALTSPSDDTSYSFLTPVSCRVGDTLYTVASAANVTSDTGTTAETLLGGATENKYRMVLSSLRNSRTADSGLGVENLDVAPVADEEYESTPTLGEQTPENQTSLSIENLNNVLSDAGFDNPFAALSLNETSTDEEGNVTLLITGIDGEQHTVKFSDFNTGFPNYFKALLASEIPMGDTFSEIYSEAQSGNVAPYGLVLGSMSALDVLVGFDTAAGGVRNPIYKPLTSKLYSQNAGKNILCRLSKFENNQLGFKRSNSAPIYNHFFVLECPPASAASASGMQLELNAASTLSDINDILESYGIANDGAGGAGTGTDIGKDACGAITDEKLLEEMAEFIESTPEPLNLMPLVRGEIAPFDGILMDSADADAIISERDELAQELKDLQGGDS